MQHLLSQLLVAASVCAFVSAFVLPDKGSKRLSMVEKMDEDGKKELASVAKVIEMSIDVDKLVKTINSDQPLNDQVVDVKLRRVPAKKRLRKKRTGKGQHDPLQPAVAAKLSSSKTSSDKVDDRKGVLRAAVAQLVGAVMKPAQVKAAGAVLFGAPAQDTNAFKQVVQP